MIYAIDPIKQELLDKTFKNVFKQDGTTSVHARPLTGGLSTEREKYFCTYNNQHYVVCFLHASEHIRKKEIEAHLYAMRVNIAPTLYYVAPNYSIIIMNFIKNGTLTFEKGRTLKLLQAVAQTCKKLAQLQPRVPPCSISSRFYKYYNQIILTESSLQPIVKQLHAIIGCLEHQIDAENRLMVFCHADLNPRNIFFAKNQLMLIDWEECGFCNEFIDLAGYSMNFCLDALQDFYLLTHYLGKCPTKNDTDYFKKLKLVLRAIDALGTLTLINIQDYDNKELMIKAFSYYQTIFANDIAANDAHFLYVLAISQLHEFFNEYYAQAYL